MRLDIGHIIGGHIVVHVSTIFVDLIECKSWSHSTGLVVY